MSNGSQITANKTIATQPLLPAPLNLTGLSDTAKDFAVEIATFAKASTKSTVAMCEVYYRAKNSLEDSDFTALCASLGHRAKSSTIKKYTLIGEKADQFRQYLDHLPNSWTTLYEITRLNGDEFQQLIVKGVISPSTTGGKIKALVAKNADAAAKPVLPPRINLQLASMTKDHLKSLISELQALSIEYKFNIELNPTASHIL